jgi:hypothetical protein
MNIRHKVLLALLGVQCAVAIATAGIAFAGAPDSSYLRPLSGRWSQVDGWQNRNTSGKYFEIRYMDRQWRWFDENFGESSIREGDFGEIVVRSNNGMVCEYRLKIIDEDKLILDLQKRSDASCLAGHFEKMDKNPERDYNRNHDR